MNYAELLGRAQPTLRRFMRQTLGLLDASDAALVLAEIENKVHLDTTKLYTAAVLSAIDRWLHWESECLEKRSSSEFCRNVEEDVKAYNDGSIGVVTYFSMLVKSLIVKAYQDLSPGVLVPQWVLIYSARIGEPLVVSLKQLKPSDQLIRLPYFAAFALTLRWGVHLLEHKYPESASELAHAVWLYVNYELVEPVAVIGYALTRELDVDELPLDYGVNVVDVPRRAASRVEKVYAPLARAVASVVRERMAEDVG